MRRTRAAYHYAVCKVKGDNERLIDERRPIADSLLDDDTRNFWSEVKRIWSKKAGTSRIVDGNSQSISI